MTDMESNISSLNTGPPTRTYGQTDANRSEQILVNFILNQVKERVTDRHGTTHEFPWLAEQQVRIGVLKPLFQIPPPQSPGASEQAVTESNEDLAHSVELVPDTVAPPIDNRGVIGLDFIVDSSLADVTLEIDVEYALYHPLLPKHAAVNEEAVRLSASQNNPRRRPTVPVRPNWIRDNRHVTYRVVVPKLAEEHTYTSGDLAERDPFAVDSRSAVEEHFKNPEALIRLSGNQTLPVADALGTESDFLLAIRNRIDPDWRASWPIMEVTVSSMPTVDNSLAISVSITNSTEVTDRNFQDFAIYDARLKVRVEEPASLITQMLGFARDDLRYKEVASVVGRGRGCIAIPGDDSSSIVAETMPIHTQFASQSDSHGVDLTFSGLIADFTTRLSDISVAMRAFLRDWDLNIFEGEERKQQLSRRSSFEEEIERFELGCDLLRTDSRLARAFVLANQSFARAKPGDSGWRLFQLVFIVSELGALAGRENPTDPRLRSELDHVDVLWFPTGGGKTEAYLGLILVALFYDRFRGKLAGVSAWLLFPLRMLSVQQLARISEVVYHAEVVRTEEELVGDPFTIGYLVGLGNTPNKLSRPAQNGWWPGIAQFARWSESERDARRLVGACPACGDADCVGLDVELSTSRLLHVCRSCRFILPILASDEEILRFQASVIVSTIDKMTSFSFNEQFTSFNRGPRKQCPDHGWYTHDKCVVPECTTNVSGHRDPVGFHDPTPALWIQDELHLVREDLGVFASHYHTLIAELARGAGHEPSKVISATATIEQFEDQLTQVYGRTPRLFPIGGPTLSKNFYTRIAPDIRRTYLGLLPAGGGTVKIDLAGIICAQLVEIIHQLTDDPTPLLDVMKSSGVQIDMAEILRLLFEYELVLAYVNSKAHGVVINDDLARLSERLISNGEDRVRSEFLMGETSLGELASVVAAVQEGTLKTPRQERIRALVGTSVVSHGVDLDRLNFEILAGMPTSYAMYIQAASRAGRSHVGLVISIFDRTNRRETSMFQSFATTHLALEKMVEPVPVNRFASRAVERTLPGILCALLLDETRNPSWSCEESITLTRRFRSWWNAVAANLIPHITDRVARAYKCPVVVPSFRVEEQQLVDDALFRWENVERPRMQQWQADFLGDLFTSPAMRSLRDVDAPTDFGSSARSGQIIDRLLG